MEKNKKQQIFKYLEIALIVLVAVFVLLSIVIQLINPDAAFCSGCGKKI